MSFLGILRKTKSTKDGFSKMVPRVTPRYSMNELGLLFGDRVVSKSLWPPWSPDLTSPDLFLCGYLKDIVYATNLHTLGELTARIGDNQQYSPKNATLCIWEHAVKNEFVPATWWWTLSALHWRKSIVWIMSRLSGTFGDIYAKYSVPNWYSF